MTRLSSLLRNNWNWSLAFLLGAVVYCVSLLEAQEPDNGPIKMKETALVTVHELRGADPQTVMDVLQTHFEGHDDLNLALDAQSKRIIARATTADHKVIQEIINKLAPSAVVADPIAVDGESPAEWYARRFTQRQSALDWEPFSESRLQQLVSEGRTVMVHFTAKWSMNGKRNLEVALDTPKVRERVKANGVIPMNADLTKHPSELWDWLKDSRMGESIPLLVLYRPKQLEQPILLRDLVTEADVLKALEDAGASQSKPDDTFGAEKMGSAMPRSVITWVKPQGEKPDWLTRGENAIRARENMRRKLDQEGEFSFDNQPLRDVVISMSDMYGFEIHLDEKGIEEQSLTPEEPITIKTKGSLRSALQRILYPLGLNYVVHEDYLEITSEMSASDTVLAYNLAHVAENSSEGESIVSTIKKMVRPDTWDDQGGNASCHLIGSVLLVKASEGAHEEIESLLAQLNTFRADERNPK